MSLRLVEITAAALRGTTGVRVGTADTRFGALQAAFSANLGEARVVPAGATASFLAPLPVGSLLRAEALQNPHAQNSRRSSDLAELVNVLVRMGLTTLGDFAELTTADVLGRFGALGHLAHQRAQGSEVHHLDWREPPTDFDTSMTLDPPVERVDQAAFIAKALAEEFCEGLAARGVTCSRVAIGARTETGEELIRLWRGETSLNAAAIAERMRWQLDGWLTRGEMRGPKGEAGRPKSGLIKLWLHPDQVRAATGIQRGLWGGQSENSKRAIRSVARVQAMLGEGKVTVPEFSAGRGVNESIVRTPVEVVDLGSRTLRDASLGQNSSTLHRSSGGSLLGESPDWSGRIPLPAPAVVLEVMVPVVVQDLDGSPIWVSSRGQMSAVPATVWSTQTSENAQGSVVWTLRSWSGPWLVDERWWDHDRRSRRVHMQVETDCGHAMLLMCTRGRWVCEAVYE